jgi:signal transduction histidine kinase
LEQKNRELTKINTELDRFVYSTSHELRAPLSSILGLINVIQYEKNSKEKKGMLAMIKSRIERLDFIIKDILSYSKNTRLNVEREHIDLNKLISKVLDDLSYMHEMKTIRIEKNIPTNLSFISDENRIMVVLNNILSNAIKYHNIDQEKPWVQICAYEVGGEIIIEIKDNGLGIADESKDKLFNMFYRGTSLKEGSGLGLFIVKEILDKLGGLIQVESTINVGSKFVITIPNNDH